MNTYETLTEAINDLRRREYIADFNLKADAIHAESMDLKLHPEQFHVDEIYRFEGASDPDDNMILYAISSNDGMVKGLMVNAYGMYADTITVELSKKLDIKHED